MSAEITDKDAGPAVGPTQPGPGGARVRLTDLRRRFGAVQALDGFSLEMKPGELVALLGPSGCGKTTALRILAGFETPDSGRIEVDGGDISRVPAQKRDMGMVFQSYSLFPNLSALDNVAFGLRMRRVPLRQRTERAQEVLDLVGLAPQADRYPHQLSGGQQQRVALARALAIQPRVLLLDEPLSALDARVRLQLREEIRSLQRRLQTTTLFVTHDQEEALSLADRVGVMREGRLEQLAPPAELYNHPATGFVAEFVGTMNRLPALVEPGGRVKVLGRTVAVRGTVRPLPGTSVTALVRPETLRLRALPGGPAVVTGSTFLGSVSRIRVILTGELAVLVDVPSEAAGEFQPGTAVEVELAGDDVLVMAD